MKSSDGDQSTNSAITTISSKTTGTSGSGSAATAVARRELFMKHAGLNRSDQTRRVLDEGGVPYRVPRSVSRRSVLPVSSG